MQPLNLSLFQWMAAGFTPNPALLGAASFFASGGPWLSTAVIGWAAWCQPRNRGFLLSVLMAAGIASLLSHGIAAALHLPRPFMLGLSPVYIAHGASGSMPSTHAAVMFTVALLFLLRNGLRQPGIALIVLASLTGWARIYVGIHFPADIGAGLLLACGMTGIIILLRWLLMHFKKKVFAQSTSRSVL